VPRVAWEALSVAVCAFGPFMAALLRA